MSQIKLRANKVLKLTNVLSRGIPFEEIMQSDKQITMLANWVKVKGYSCYN